MKLTAVTGDDCSQSIAISAAGWPHNPIRKALLAPRDALAAEEVRARLLQAILNGG